MPFPGTLGGRLHPIAGSAGVLRPGVEARLVRDDGSDIDAPGEVGELYLKGKNLSPGYWKNPTATAETFLPGGWMRTGDRFRVDAEGNFL